MEVKSIIKITVIVIIIAALFTGCCVACSHSASWERYTKTLDSNYGGGLNRTVTAYDYNGNVLGQWTGTFDVSESETETYFDIDGKRVIIQNAIIINEEN